MDWIWKRAIAHRGLQQGTVIPENSISAFEAAIEQDHPIELDIHLLADGGLAVFHDKELERVTGVKGKIADQTLATLKSFRLFGTDQHIPSLDEVLQLVNGRVPILIEIKNEGEVGKLEQVLLNKVTHYSGEFAIQAFNPYSLGWFKTNAPHISRGQLSGNFKGEDLPWYQKFLLSNLLMNWASAPDFISYDLTALPNMPTTTARRLFKRPLIAWTVRNQADQDKARRYADNTIFDRF